MDPPRIGIVASRADAASMAIRDALLDRENWTRERDNDRPAGAGGGDVYRTEELVLRTFDELHLELQSVGGVFRSPDAIVFVSRHAGETGPLLSTHVPGNVGEAAYGGSAHTLPQAAPGLMKRVFRGLQRHRPATYDVAIECTHHGPSAVGAPTLFVEIGSGPAEWTDRSAATAVAAALLSAADVDPVGKRTVAGFGGGHYAPRFRRILDETGWQVGHIASDWALEDIEASAVRDQVVRRAIAASHADVALVDGTHPSLVESLQAMDTPVVSETWLREADGTPLPVVSAIERALGPIDDGTRIGGGTIESADDLEVATLPDALVEALNGRAGAAAVERIANRTAAYTTTDNGNRLASDVVLVPERDLPELVRSLRPALEKAYKEVAFEGDTLVLRDEVFDPTEARALGVPEGPAFGRLAEGDVVEVDGHRVKPADVTSVRELRIPLIDD